MTAANLQSRFASALLDPATAPPRGIRPHAGRSPDRLFAVHRNNMLTSLVDAVSDAFPVTRALVGDDFFAAMTVEWIRAEPPSSPVLHRYGETLAAFIDRFPPAADLAWLGDVARLEQARIRVFHAADAATVDPGEWNALLIEPERLAAVRLRLHPATAWLRSSHAVRSLWNAHQPPPAQSASTHESGNGPQVDRSRIAAVDIDQPDDALIIRKALEVELHAMPPGGFELLEALARGDCLGAAMTAACAEHPGAQMPALLTLLVQHPLVVAIDRSDENASTNNTDASP